MHPVLQRLKRERRWAVLLFILTAATITLVQYYLVPRAIEIPSPSAVSEISG